MLFLRKQLAIPQKLRSAGATLATSVCHMTLVLHIQVLTQESPRAMLFKNSDLGNDYIP